MNIFQYGNWFMIPKNHHTDPSIDILLSSTGIAGYGLYIVLYDIACQKGGSLPPAMMASLAKRKFHFSDTQFDGFVEALKESDLATWDADNGVWEFSEACDYLAYVEEMREKKRKAVRTRWDRAREKDNDIDF